MQGSEDVVVLVLLLIVLGLWALFSLKRWLDKPRQLKLPAKLKMTNHETLKETDDDFVQFMQGFGFELVSGKIKIPIHIDWNDTSLESRLFIDYLARQGDLIYIVKLARDRKPLDYTGSGMRDRLLVYQLLYENIAGVLYVDLPKSTLHKIEFKLDLL